jgi:hypothetical protein
VPLIVALVIVGAALRFYRLDTALWYDEIVTVVESVRLPLADIVTRFGGDNHHPLYSVLAHLAVSVFGEQPWALRLPAALFGVATIPLLYVFGREVAGRVEAMAAAVVLTVSYHHVWFSQNARGYTAVLFFVLLSTYALLRWLDTRRSWFAWLFVLSTALGAYAHMTTVLVAIGQGLACATALAGPGRDERLRTARTGTAVLFLAAALLTLLMYAPMLADVGSVMTSGKSSGVDQAALSWTVAAVLQGLQVGFGAVWFIVPAILVFGAGLWSYVRQRPLVPLLFVLPVVVTVAAAVALDRPVRPRFMFFSAGFALLFTVRGAAMVGAGVGRTIGVGRSAAAQAAVAIVTVGAVVLSARSLPYGYRFPKQDYVEAVTFVEQAMHSGDRVAVVADGGEIPIVRYLGRPWPRIDTGAELDALRHDGRPVWVVSTFQSYIESLRPDLWEILATQCTEMREVEATVEDGDIAIHRCP